MWRWQPAENRTDQPPAGNWGYFKVPGCWPGIGDYMQKDCQTVYAHPSWKDAKLAAVAAAWHQREISVPKQWAGRRVSLRLEYLNSSAVVYVDGRKAGEIQFPAGKADLTAVCPPGGKHVLSILVVARPMQRRHAHVQRHQRGQEGKGPRRAAGCAATSTSSANPPRADRRREGGHVGPQGPDHVEHGADEPGAPPSTPCKWSSRNMGARSRSSPARRSLPATSRTAAFAVTEKWKPEKLWDIHTPQNVYEAAVFLLDAEGEVLDAAHPVRFGFREFWIDGRDFYLNGSRIFLSALPLDNAQVSALAASYEGAKESLLRLKGIGINFVYTHNYGCEPGAHLSFAGDFAGGRRRGDARLPLPAALLPVRLENARASAKNGYPQYGGSTSASPAAIRRWSSTR